MLEYNAFLQTYTIKVQQGHKYKKTTKTEHGKKITITTIYVAHYLMNFNHE